MKEGVKGMWIDDFPAFETVKDRDTFTRLTAFLKEYTGSEGWYWYPLCALKREVPVAAYDVDQIYREGKIEQIEKVIRVCKIAQCISFQIQYGNMKRHSENLLELIYERDSDGYTFPWHVETFYFDDSRKWMIYVSHEGTITFTGEMITKAALKWMEGEPL